MQAAKKVLAIVLCVLMILGTISACGKQDPASDNSTPSDTTNTDTDKSSENTNEATENSNADVEDSVSLERTEEVILENSYPCNKIIFQYDKDGKLVSKRWEYATGAMYANVADFFWEQTYDAAGNILDTTETWTYEEAKEFFTFDPDTQTFRKDRDGLVYSYRYNDMGKILESFFASYLEDGTLSDSDLTLHEYNERGLKVYSRYEWQNNDPNAYNYGLTWSEETNEYNDQDQLIKKVARSHYNPTEAGITTYTYNDQNLLATEYYANYDETTERNISFSYRHYYYNEQGYQTLSIQKSNTTGTQLTCYRTNVYGIPDEVMSLKHTSEGLEILSIYNSNANYEFIGEKRVVYTNYRPAIYSDQLVKDLELGFDAFPLAYLQEKLNELPLNFSFKDLESNIFYLSDYLDKPIVLTVWTLEAEEALGENKFLQKLQTAYEKYGDKVHFLVVHYSDDCFSDKQDNAVDYMSQTAYTFPAYYSEDWGNGAIADDLFTTTFPTTYFIKTNATIQNTCPGVMDDAALVTAIEALLQAN